MKFKVRTIQNKITLTSTEDDAYIITLSYKDLNYMVADVKRNGYKIINPEVLPIAFQNQLK